MIRRLRQFGKDLWQTWNEWQQDDGFLLAAAVAYYVTVALFPLLLILMAGLGLFFQFTDPGRDVRNDLLAAVAQYTSSDLERQLRQLVTETGDTAPVSGPVGLLTLLLAALSIFAQFETAFDRVWNIEDPQRRGIAAALHSILLERLRAFLMLLGLGLLVLAVFVAGTVMTTLTGLSGRILPWADWVGRLLPSLVGLALNATVFTILYRVLPKAPVRWSEAARGGALTAVIWEIGRQVLAQVVIGAKYTTAYGMVGALIAVMLWVYYASATVFFGAEYVQVICRRCAERQGPPSSPTHRPDL